jgi:uncharacterized protein
MRRVCLRLLLSMQLLFACALAQADDFLAVPPLQGHVNDLAGMLTPTQRSTLENVLTEYETRTGSQIAILLVKSTAPEAIEQYSIRVADAWKLGRKGIDDGVILLVAKDNPPALNRLRIEAGRGVQGELTDAQSKRILQDVIAPHFRQGDFYGGLTAGVSVITALLDKEAFPQPQPQQHRGEASGDSGLGLSPFIFFAILIAITLLRSRGGRGARIRHSSDGWGNSAGVILGSALGNAWGRRSGGDFGGFDGGGGFGGGGGFSGGGGGFDGGGASGNW